MERKRLLISLCLLVITLTRTGLAQEVKINPDGSVNLKNSLLHIKISSRPGSSQGILSWFFKSTGYEMVDVLYGQTDYVRGHLLGEQWDPVNWKEFQGKAPQAGRLFIPVVYGTNQDGSGAVLIQVSEGAYRLTKKWVLRRDLATIELSYKLENICGEVSAFSLRLHSAASPGARGKYQKKDDTIFLETEAGILELDQSLNLTQYREKYKNDKFFNASWKDEPARHWVSGKLPTPVLKGNWAAWVNRSSSDTLCFLVEEKTLVGFYNCPGITLEPVLKTLVLKPGDTWETKVYLSSCTGVKEKVYGINPLFLVVYPFFCEQNLLQGKIIPFFTGKLLVVEKTGNRIAEYRACPDTTLIIKTQVNSDWKLVAVDSAGKTIGQVDSSGKFNLSQIEVKTKPVNLPPVKTDVYQRQQQKQIDQFLQESDFTIYCSAEASPEEKKQAIPIARKTGAGLAWTNPGGKLLIIGNPETNQVVKEIGCWKNSVSLTWPGKGKGAILFYPHYEDTQESVLLISGSDASGTVKAARKFITDYLKEKKEPEGFIFWVAGADRKIYPYSRAHKEKKEKVSLKAARGEYEVEQLAITAFQKIKNLKVTLSPLVHEKTGKEIDRRYKTAFRKKHAPLWLRWVYYYPVEPDRWEKGWTGYPDVLLERPVSSLDAGQTQALWLTVIVSENAEPGVYHSTLTCTGDDVSQTIPLELTVRNFSIPEKGLGGDPYIHLNQFPPDARRELKKQDIESLVINLVEHGMRVIHLGPPEMFRWHFSPEGKYKNLDIDWLEVNDDGTVALDTSYFDWLVETIDAAGKPWNLRYMLYELALLGRQHSEFKKIFPKRFEGKTSREGVHWIADYYAEEMIGLFKKHLLRKGWLERFVLKVSDEPPGFQYWWEKLTPAARAAGMPLMTAFNNIDYQEAEKGLGVVKLWQILYMLHNSTFFQKAKQAGDLVSWYNCGPPPKTAVSAPASEWRSYLWQAARYDLDLISWWGIQCWEDHDEVWRSRYSHWNSVMYPVHPEKPAWIKPGKGWVDTSPVDSIRWEIIREGMEDAWYVNLLRSMILQAKEKGWDKEAEKAQNILENIWNDVFPTLNDYNMPYELILACREKVASAIEQLQEKLSAK